MKLKNIILSTTLLVSATAFSGIIKDGEKIEYFEGKKIGSISQETKIEPSNNENKIESTSQETKIDSNLKKENLKIRIDLENFRKKSKIIDYCKYPCHKLPYNKEKLGYYSKTLNKIASENSSVEDWSLSQNYLSDEYLAFVLNILKKSKSMKTLCLEHNHINAKSAKEIIDILNKENLTTLDLSSALFEHYTIDQIVNALKENKSLIVLNIGDKSIAEKTGKLILEMLETNKTLKKIKISKFNHHDSITDKTFSAIKYILRKRKHKYKDILIEFKK